MNPISKITLVLFSAMILFSTLSWGTNNEEFSRDFARAHALRNSKDIKGLESMVKEIQKTWSQKDRRKYGYLMVNTLNSWASACKRSDKKPPMNVIHQYATQVLSTYDPNKADDISIETEFDLVSILHEQYEYSKVKHTDDEWISTRREGAERWFHAWRRLENAIDKDWDPNDIPTENVDLPEGVTGFPGMPPELIKDPALRAEYEQAIKKNREKTEIRNEQLNLRNTKNRYRRIVEKYLISTYSIPPYANEELSKYVNEYIAEEKTRSRILDTVKKNIEAQAEKAPKEPVREPPPNSTQR